MKLTFSKQLFTAVADCMMEYSLTTMTLVTKNSPNLSY